MPPGSPTPNTLRHQARRRIERVCGRWGWLCRWCGCEVTTARRAGYFGTVLRVTRKTVLWVDGGGTKRLTALAVCDHLVPIRDGGDSREDNLVPSCDHCNNARTATPPARDPALCRKCGCPKEDHRRKRCRACRRGDPLRRKEANPWAR